MKREELDAMTPDQRRKLLVLIRSNAAARVGPAALPARPPAKGQPDPPPCVHRGDQLTGRERIVRGLDHRRAWVWCESPRRIELGLAEVTCGCVGCGPTCSGYVADGEPDPPPPPDPDDPPPAFPVRLDESNLWVGTHGYRFNPTLMADGDGYLFAVRNGWRGSEVYVGRLDAAFRPAGGPTRLDLAHPLATYGREDPRLFRLGGRPHVSFIGVEGGRGVRRTNQLYARLSPDGTTAEAVYAPDLPGRRAWEKNWSFFDHGGQLYAVYLTAPTHRVLEIDGDAAEVAHETPFPWPWAGGEIRGGASPVLVGGEWWSFFHDRVDRGRRVYRMGLYTFSAGPPFRPLRMIPGPILSADDASVRASHDNYCDCVFPGGAVLAGGRWVVALGVHDRWAALHEFDHADLEARLIPAPAA